MERSSIGKARALITTFPEQALDEVRQVPFGPELRSFYEDFLVHYPTASHVWTRYAEQEVAAHNFSAVKLIFSRCLLTCPSVELWSAYLKFIKQVNEGRGPEGLLEVKTAYEFTLYDCIGHDISAGPLWQEYIQFLQAPKRDSPGYLTLFGGGQMMSGGHEDVQKNNLIRRAYQHAVLVPGHMLDTLWRGYEQFESLHPNKAFVQKLFAEFRPKYQAVRGVLAERKKRLQGIQLRTFAMPPGTGGPQQEEQVRLWKEYLEFEKSNLQRLEGGPLQNRLTLAFDQALMALWHFPEVWYDYACWHLAAGGGQQLAVTVLTRAQKALPTCLMLRFALADLEEMQGHVEAARQVYEELATTLESQAAAAPGPGSGQSKQGAPQDTLGGRFSPQMGGVLWIQYMKFLRRADSLKASRQLFLRAKKWPPCPWHVYVASALTEWRLNKEETIARRIFEKGLENPNFMTEPDYILQYVQFLCDVGDTSNARALFERVLIEESNKNSRKLWDRYLEFEFEMGDISAALQLEIRAREALGSEPTSNMKMLVMRYHHLGLWPCSTDQQHYLSWLLNWPLQGGAAAGPTGGSSPHLHHPGENGRAFHMRPPRPSYAQMLPIALSEFLDALPPVDQLPGTTIDVDSLIESLLQIEFTSAALQIHAQDEGEDVIRLTPNAITMTPPYMGGNPPNPPGVRPPGSFTPPAAHASPAYVAAGPTPPREPEEHAGTKRPGNWQDSDGVADHDSVDPPAPAGGPGPVRDAFQMRMKQRARVAASGD